MRKHYFKTDIEQLLLFNIPPINTEIIDLPSGNSKWGQFNIYPSIINSCSNMFSHALLDYAKKGGDMSELTFKKVYQIRNNDN
jgi:hypothetical protein